VTSLPVEVVRWTRPEGTTLRLVLVRHGEPEASAHGRCYGRLDVDLSPRGRQQMRRVARLLESAPLAAVYCSPRRRARESGEIVAAPHGLAPRSEDRFREIDFGSLEGLTYDQAAERFPEIYKAWMERPTEVQFPGGESLSMMRIRVVSAAGELMGRHGGHTIAIVLVGPLAAAACWGATILVTAAVGRGSRRRIGGVTGDIMGAASELTEVAVFAVAVAFSG
jgi:broad specificity phosphatase PhoE